MSFVDKSTQKKADVLRALGHPVRVQIFNLLSTHNSRNISVKQIQESLGLTQVQASRHLIVLKNATILSCGKKGNNAHYFINEQNPFIRALAVCINNLDNASII